MTEVKTNKIVTSAPTKIILTGEHSVVHGSWAIAVPINLRNRVELTSEEPRGKPELFLEEVGEPKWWARMHADGTFEGNEAYKCLFEMAKHIFSQNGTSLEKIGKNLRVELHFCHSPKGTGNSASVAAALALALNSLLGKKPSRQELFETVQVSEKVVHGAPSGVDARTVVSDNAQKFRKEFLPDGSTKFHFQDIDLKLPRDTTLLVINTSLPEAKTESTGELVTRFSQTHFKKNPGELTSEERKRITEPFNEIVLTMEKELHEEGNPQKLGELFNKNHLLLANGRVSSPRIEEARKICLEAGALGAKLTGAGGSGGAVIALVKKEKAKALIEALKGGGFRAFEAQTADRGASAGE